MHVSVCSINNVAATGSLRVCECVYQRVRDRKCVNMCVCEEREEREREREFVCDKERERVCM